MIRVFTSRIMVYLFGMFLLFGLGAYLTNYFVIQHVKRTYLNLPYIKNTIYTILKSKLNKALDIGVIDFNLYDGVFIEDIRISQEEDFSKNNLLFTSKKLSIRLTSPFSKTPSISKLVVQNSRINIDLDDPLKSSILEDIRDKHIPVIEFKETDILFFKNKQLIFRTDQPINFVFTKKENQIEFQFDDSKYNMKSTMIVNGHGVLDIIKKRLHINISLKQFAVNKMIGLAEQIIYMSPESGKCSGNVELKLDDTNTTVQGELNFEALHGKFFTSLFVVRELRLLSKFNYQSNLKEIPKEKNKREILINRYIEIGNIKSKEEIFVGVNDLHNYKLDFQSENVGYLVGFMERKQDFNMSGSVKVNLNISETGNVKDWLKINASSEIENFEAFNKLNPFTKISIKKMIMNFTQDHKLVTNINGSLFDEPIKLDILGNIIFQKWVSEGTTYYPMKSDITLNSQIQRVIVDNFANIFKFLSNKVDEDIKERQEKILPNVYFIVQPVYKVFLDNLNLKSSILIDDLKFKNDSISLGQFKNTIDIRNGSTELRLFEVKKQKVEKTESKKSDRELSLYFRAYYNNKNPYIDFGLKISKLEWKDTSWKFCDTIFRSDMINLDYTLSSIGNNFSDLYVSRIIRSDLNGVNTIMQRIPSEDNFSLFEKIQTPEIFQFKYSFNTYSREKMNRSFEIKADDISYKGSASGLSSFPFSISGSNKGKSLNLSFVENNSICQQQN